MTAHFVSIIRPQYLPNAAAFDPTVVNFFVALKKWLAGRKDALCLICERSPFAQEKPSAFFLVEFDVENGKPRKLILSGICAECGTRSDSELGRAGLRGLFGDDLARQAKEVLDPSGHDGMLS